MYVTLLYIGFFFSAATVAVGLGVIVGYRHQFGAAVAYLRGPEVGTEWARWRVRQKHKLLERRRKRLIRREAGRLQKQIVASLTRQGLARVQERRGAVTFYAKIRIEAVIMTADGLYYKIDNRTPFGITFTDLIQPEVAENLSGSINREARVILTTELGCWVIVGLRSGIASIPKRFPWKAAETERNGWELLPKTKPFHIPIGVGENYKYVHADVRDFVHVLVAGTTGGGKSMFMNMALLTLINRVPPYLLKLAMVDLKGGLEFTPYDKIPHLLTPICYKREEVPAMLQLFSKEKERRFNLLRGRGFKDINAWNALNTMKMPHWILVFDEIQNLILDPKIKAQVEDLLSDLAFQGRAVGLSVWLCTQFPEKKVISTAIRANTPTKICFSTTITGSMLVLDDTAAAKLPLGGRAVFRMAGHENTVVQTPFIGKMTQAGRIDKRSEQTMIEDEIRGAIKKWRRDDNAEDAAAVELFQHLITDYAGKAAKRLCLQASTLSERKLVPLLKKWDYDPRRGEPIIEFPDGSHYILATVPQPGGYGRWVVPIDSPPQDQGEIEKLYYAWIRGGFNEAMATDTIQEVDDRGGDDARGDNRGDIWGGSDEREDERPEVRGGFFSVDTKNDELLTSVNQRDLEEERF
jgi:hypothetical protein